MAVIVVQALAPSEFAPYGEVFAAPAAGRLDHVAALVNRRAGARPNLFLVRSAVMALPHSFARMESHPHSSQTFAPNGPARIVIAVALPGPDGAPDVGTLRGFLADGQGFSYRPGVWHLPLAALDGPASVTGFMYEDGSPEDCIWAEVEPSRLTAG